MDPFVRLRDLNLPIGEYAVYGSGPLIVRGIVEFTNDLDVVCRSEAWATVAALGEVHTYLDTGNELVSLADGTLSFGTTWVLGDIDIDEVIDTAEVIDGIAFARIEYVERFKLAADRAKDREHLEALARWRSRQENEA